MNSESNVKNCMWPIYYELGKKNKRHKQIAKSMLHESGRKTEKDCVSIWYILC